jgi:hypothetical protein
MKTENVFQLELSRSELLWLADILGFVQFPLLGVENPSNDIQVELTIAQQKLQDRGLVTYQPNLGWQVEKMLMVISQLIANPDKVLMSQIWNRDGTSRRAFAYPSQDFPLFVEDTDSLHFTLHSRPSGLVAQQQAFFKLPAKPILARKSFSIPNKVLPYFLSLTEGEINVALAESGIGEKEAVKLAKSLEGIKSMGIQSTLLSHDGDLESISQTYLIWNDKNIFGGVWAKEVPVTEFRAFIVSSAYKWVTAG